MKINFKHAVKMAAAAAMTAVMLLAVGCGSEAAAPEKTVPEIGSTIEMGSFDQNAETEGAEPIEWIVITNEDGKTLLLSKYCLTAMPYDSSEDAGQSWETSTLRAWLNGEFLTASFSEEEQAKIASAEHANAFEDDNGTNPTEDKVFILSEEEIEKYIPEEGRKAVLKATPAADPEALAWWWIRTPGYINTYTAVVKTNGVVYTRGDSVINELGGIRPAVWVSAD